MQIVSNHDLTKLNTFGVPATARFFTAVESEADLATLFEADEFKNNEKLFLGGGSNVLFTRDFPGIVIQNKIKGIEILSEDDTSALLKIKSGEVWHDIVTFVVEHGWWGVENLSLIPGTVGAAPMQNIGAYGGELKSVLENVEAIEIATGARRIFEKVECELGYRDSVFKNNLKNKYFILSVTLRLSKIEKKNIGYKILKEHLEKNNIEVKNSKHISDAVADIRRSKLPDPAVIGNAGSFFKNVFVDEAKYQELLALYPEIPHFREENTTKIPAAWLIEQCGFKGKRVGNVGVHEKQALVLVNYGGGTGLEIKKLAEEIISVVDEKFGIKLVPEVNFI